MTAGGHRRNKHEMNCWLNLRRAKLAESPSCCFEFLMTCAARAPGRCHFSGRFGFHEHPKVPSEFENNTIVSYM
jgi:hypothetical protein